MNKKILLIVLVTLTIITSSSVVSAGLFDGFFEQQDNVVEIDNISFNTTNVTKFVLLNKTEQTGVCVVSYIDENDTGYTINIINASTTSDSLYNQLFTSYTEEFDNSPSQTVDGVILYTTSANTGDNVGKPRYTSYFQNKDAKNIVEISSPNPNETAKMVLSFKFK